MVDHYLYLCGFFTPPVLGALLRAAFVASCFLGALPPVDYIVQIEVNTSLYLVSRLQRHQLTESHLQLPHKVDMEDDVYVAYFSSLAEC
jgi:hypothetical protein